jgi:hypothetical protein
LPTAQCWKSIASAAECGLEMCVEQGSMSIGIY